MSTNEDMEKIQSSYRLMPRTHELLDELSARLGLPKQSVIDMAVKEYAERELPEPLRRGK